MNLILSSLALYMQMRFIPQMFLKTVNLKKLLVWVGLVETWESEISEV